jgi:hypothetical protein
MKGCSMGFSDVIRVAVIAALLSLLLAACGGGGGGDPPVYTVTGVITPDALNRVDSDTNDPETSVVGNNDPDEAQVVVAPAIIGGLVAAPGPKAASARTVTQPTCMRFNCRPASRSCSNMRMPTA